ncbi:hypothetical protein DL96DRAFT_1789773 [Flagelloscypha sp. PMI_526]|nr:hypothetical protein DL96DRAFT_1789773 [Flagelloscypha sp. PMI_526]
MSRPPKFALKRLPKGPPKHGGPSSASTPQKPPPTSLLRNAMVERQKMANDQVVSENPAAAPAHKDVDTKDFDVSFPLTRPPPGNAEKRWEIIQQNIINEAKNVFSLFQMAQIKGTIPGFDIEPGFRNMFRVPRKVLSTRSVDPGSPLAPLRTDCTESYIKLLTATFKQDSHQASDFSTSVYRSSLLEQIEKMKKAGVQTFWQYHGEVSPPKIYSIRATYNPFAAHAGNPFAAQLLVRFDTMQSIERYAPDGRALHKPAENYVPSPSGGKQRIPAEPQRVTEYLLLERKWWLFKHFRVRRRLVPPPGEIPKDDRYQVGLVRWWKRGRSDGFGTFYKNCSKTFLDVKHVYGISI